jgi:dihydrofolate reductase
MGRLVINNAMSVNGAFEASAPEPDGWLVLEADINQVSLEQFLAADGVVLGRKTYEGLAAVWPQLVDDPTLGVFADHLAESVSALKDRHDRTLVAVGAGELAHALITMGLVDEFWFWVSPSLWPSGPRIFDGVGPVRLELIGSTTFRSGVVRLAYRPAPDGQDAAGA